MATKKKASASKKTGRDKVGKVMHEFKHGELKSSSGQKVKNPKQAIAIGISEARSAGANIPDRRSAAKKAAGKKSAAKKVAKRSASSKKTAVKKAPAKRAVKKAAKKAAAKRTR